MNLGIVFAVVAMLAWGLDDFFIEKSTRRFGNILTLFFVTAFGSLVLLPFVWGSVVSLEFWQANYKLAVLGLAVVITLVAALCDYEALRIGKLAIVEPIYALEIPVTLFFGSVVIGEFLSWYQLILVAFLTAGVFLVASRTASLFHYFKNFTWERGVRYALLSAVFMGATNFITGYSGRLVNPLVANWFIYFGLATFMLVYSVYSKQVGQIWPRLKSSPKLIFAVSSADLVAWTAFTYSAFYIPIALAVAISEAYIALAALLGLIINKEKLKTHQLAGLGLVVVSVIVLAAST